MASLDVYAVEPDLRGKPRRIGVAFGERGEGIVGQDAILGERLVALKQRTVLRNQRFGVAVRLGIAPRMGQLTNNQRRVAVLPHGNFPHSVKQFFVCVCVFFGQHHLAGIRPRFGQDCGGFEPDQPGAAVRETVIAADSQLSGRAVPRAVAAFHRLIDDAVRERVSRRADGGGKGRGAVQIRELFRQLRRIHRSFIHGIFSLLFVMPSWQAFPA